MSTDEFIPADLIIGILVRLPVISLLRLRCVCKLWCRIISSSSFIESHHRHSRTRPDGNFIFICHPFRQITREKKFLCSRYQWEGEDCNGFTQYLSSYKLSESINGLICLTSGPSIQVCNFSTRESVMLPPATKLGFSESSCSLGFDPRSNTYKILWNLMYDKPYQRNLEILTLGSNSWRKVVGDPLYFRVLQNRRSVCVGGSLYWKAMLWLDRILAFDLAEDKFRLLAPPPGWTYNSSLARLEGRLAVVDYSCLINDKTMRIWTFLEEDADDQKNGPGVWSIERRIVFSFLCTEVRPPGPPRDVLVSESHSEMVTTLDGEFIIEPEFTLGEEAYIYLRCYHLESGSLKLKSLIKPREAHGKDFTWRPEVFNYVESLVSLRQVINSNNPQNSHSKFF